MELTQEQINDIVTAVFSLMESQGMLPESQLDVLAQNVKRRLQLDSVGVDEVPLVDSIEGINSLRVYANPDRYLMLSVLRWNYLKVNWQLYLSFEFRQAIGKYRKITGIHGKI
ncbi:hypothetical protein [Bacteroides thetaiotaomicron]|uniref:hypothetical protein n=1 Tax=Bacteroides thetaiotaomicron TaxID=818 RepID=UPI001EE12E99|nr:hypothetical protein [Bacteroides thetaiotaomicron]